MKFAYLLLADGANITPEGKANLLGAGFHKVQVPNLPVSINVTIAGSIEATIEEAGVHRFSLELEDPQGNVTTLIDDDQMVIEPQQDNPPDLPRGVNFQVALQALLSSAGIYRVRARVDHAQADYVFQVRIKNEDDQAPAPTGGRNKKTQRPTSARRPKAAVQT